jgi:hypothetical protein
LQIAVVEALKVTLDTKAQAEGHASNEAKLAVAERALETTAGGVEALQASAMHHEIKRMRNEYRR